MDIRLSPRSAATVTTDVMHLPVYLLARRERTAVFRFQRQAHGCRPGSDGGNGNCPGRFLRVLDPGRNVLNSRPPPASRQATVPARKAIGCRRQSQNDCQPRSQEESSSPFSTRRFFRGFAAETAAFSGMAPGRGREYGLHDLRREIGRLYISTITSGRRPASGQRLLRSLHSTLTLRRRENVKVVTPSSLVTLISSLCCC